MFAQVDDTASNGFYCAYSGIATQAKSNDFALHTVFLGIKGKGGKGCATKLGISSCGNIEKGRAEETLDTAKIEWLSIRW